MEVSSSLQGYSGVTNARREVKMTGAASKSIHTQRQTAHKLQL